MPRPDLVAVIVFPTVTIHVPNIGEVPMIGHAAVLFINGGTGLTKYYEYGRYSNPPHPQEDGIVRRQRIPDVTIDRSGKPDKNSLRSVYRSISEQSGKKTEIRSVMLPADDQFDVGIKWCDGRLALNGDSRREKYSPLTNNCCHFAAAAAGKVVSSMYQPLLVVIDPIPHGYIKTLQLLSIPVPGVHNIDYDYTSDKLS
jgi:hypothetical protein